MGQKTITSFWLGVWLGTLTADEKKKWFGAVVVDLSTGGEIFGTKVVKEFSLAEWQEAVGESAKVASDGKCVFKPQK